MVFPVPALSACWTQAFWFPNLAPSTWRFPKSWGYPESSSVYRWIFDYKPTSELGVASWLWKPLGSFVVIHLPHKQSPDTSFTSFKSQEHVECNVESCADMRLGALNMGAGFEGTWDFWNFGTAQLKHTFWAESGVVSGSKALVFPQFSWFYHINSEELSHIGNGEKLVPMTQLGNRQIGKPCRNVWPKTFFYWGVRFVIGLTPSHHLSKKWDFGKHEILWGFLSPRAIFSHHPYFKYV